MCDIIEMTKLQKWGQSEGQGGCKGARGSGHGYNEVNMKDFGDDRNVLCLDCIYINVLSVVPVFCKMLVLRKTG